VRAGRGVWPESPKKPSIAGRLGERRAAGRRGRLYDGWEFEHKGKDFQVQVKGTLISNDSALIARAAMDGMGMIYTAEDAIRDDVRAGKLEIVLAPFAATSAGFYLYYPSHSQTLPKLRAFIDHVKARHAA
jgi:DNA-binding transcriptional LysR family regulator